MWESLLCVLTLAGGNRLDLFLFDFALLVHPSTALRYAQGERDSQKRCLRPVRAEPIEVRTTLGHRKRPFHLNPIFSSEGGVLRHDSPTGYPTTAGLLAAPSQSESAIHNSGRRSYGTPFCRPRKFWD
jgi:hypothetical protein